MCIKHSLMLSRRLLLILLIVLMAVTIINSEAIAHDRKLLVEIFTSSFCPICPRWIPPVQDALEEGFDDLIFIQYHAWWVGDDPWYFENYERHLPEQDDMRTRIFWMGYDNTLGVPSFFFDGHRIRYGNDVVDNSVDYVAERLDEESPLQIEIEAFTYGDTLLTTVSITSEAILSNLTLFMALCEREIEYIAPSGQRRFTGNVIDLFPDGEGYRFSIVRNYEMVYETESPLIMGWCENELDNLQVVAWIQRQDLEILQSESVAIELLSAPEYPTQIPITTQIEAVYPNPFNSTASIPFSLRHNGHVLLTLH
ncbi:MAG: hypothetical protein HQ568_10320, partial [Calditrichaeota bacterium]|nr:hypothetical protein [Calditrichota bacterium]